MINEQAVESDNNVVACEHKPFFHCSDGLQELKLLKVTAWPFIRKATYYCNWLTMKWKNSKLVITSNNCSIIGQTLP